MLKKPLEDILLDWLEDYGEDAVATKSGVPYKRIRNESRFEDMVELVKECVKQGVDDPSFFKLSSYRDRIVDSCRNPRDPVKERNSGKKAACENDLARAVRVVFRAIEEGKIQPIPEPAEAERLEKIAAITAPELRIVENKPSPVTDIETVDDDEEEDSFSPGVQLMLTKCKPLSEIETKVSDEQPHLDYSFLEDMGIDPREFGDKT